MSNTELTKASTSSLSTLSNSLQIKQEVMISTIKAQCFKGSRPESISNEQLAAYVSVANALREICPMFNPLLSGFLYAYPSKNGGVEPMIGPDGVYCILANHNNVDGWDTEIEFKDGKPFACTASIYLKEGMPRKKKVFFSEWNVGTNPNWRDRPIHMLETRALKQAARMVIHGLPFDEDDRAISQAVDAEFTETKPRKELPANLPPALSKALGGTTTADAGQEPEEDAKVPENGGEAYLQGFSIVSNPFDANKQKTKHKAWAAEFETTEEKIEGKLAEEDQQLGGMFEEGEGE